MADTKVFALDEGKNAYETLTREQITAAIMQAVNEGTIGDLDAGFITKIQEMNQKGLLRFWVGTMAEFNALETKDPDTLYLFSDDPTVDDIEEAIEAVENSVSALEANLEAGAVVPAIAEKARTDIDGDDIRISYVRKAQAFIGDELSRDGTTVTFTEDTPPLQEDGDTVVTVCLRSHLSGYEDDPYYVGSVSFAATSAISAGRVSSWVVFDFPSVQLSDAKAVCVWAEVTGTHSLKIGWSGIYYSQTVYLDSVVLTGTKEVND